MLGTHLTNTYLLKALNNQPVKYMVIGGLAVQFYCPKRPVQDLDILVDAAAANGNRVAKALCYLANGGLISSREIYLSRKFSGYGKCLKLRAALCADIFLAKEGYDFSSAYAHSIDGTLNDVPVQFVSICDLITYKETDDEPADKIKNERDVQLLRKEIQRRFRESFD